MHMHGHGELYKIAHQGQGHFKAGKVMSKPSPVKMPHLKKNKRIQNAYVDSSWTEARLLHNAICREDSDCRIATYGAVNSKSKHTDIVGVYIGVYIYMYVLDV